MRWFALMAVLAVSVLHAELPWAGTLTPDHQGAFPPIKPFTGEFRFGWSNIEAATAKSTFVRRGDKMIVDVSGGTTGLARTLWQLDATHHAELFFPQLDPIGFQQTETYAKRTVKMKAEYRPDGLWRLRTVRPGPGGEKWKHIKFGPVYDMITGMLFIRSQPLADKDKIRLIVFPGDTPFLTDVTVLGRENIKIGGKTIPAIKLDFRPQRIEKNKQKDSKGKEAYHLEPHGKFTRGTVWISDDQYRVPLRSEVDIFIGYVFAELKSITFDDGKTYP
jgi:Protein of unknown function (DUF3108)